MAFLVVWNRLTVPNEPRGVTGQPRPRHSVFE